MLVLVPRRRALILALRFTVVIHAPCGCQHRYTGTPGHLVEAAAEVVRVGDKAAEAGQALEESNEGR